MAVATVASANLVAVSRLPGYVGAKLRRPRESRGNAPPGVPSGLRYSPAATLLTRLTSVKRGISEDNWRFESADS